MRHPLAIAAALIATALVVLGLAGGPADFVVGMASATALLALSVVAVLGLAGPVLAPVIVLAVVIGAGALWVRSGRRRVALSA